MSSKDIIIELLALTGQLVDFGIRIAELKEQVEPDTSDADYAEQEVGDHELKITELAAELYDILAYLRGRSTPPSS